MNENTSSNTQIKLFDFGKYEYYSIKKDKLTLRHALSEEIIHIGKETDQTDWQILIHFASQEPEKWIVEEIIEE